MLREGHRGVLRGARVVDDHILRADEYAGFWPVLRVSNPASTPSSLFRRSIGSLLLTATGTALGVGSKGHIGQTVHGHHVTLVFTHRSTRCYVRQPCVRRRMWRQVLTNGGGRPASAALEGMVTDEVRRPLSGATIRVLEGPMAGTPPVTTDASGWFYLYSTKWGTVTLQVNRAGFTSAIHSTEWNPANAAFLK